MQAYRNNAMSAFNKAYQMSIYVHYWPYSMHGLHSKWTRQKRKCQNFYKR